MSWINVIEYGEADEKLRRIYDRVKGPEGEIDNVLTIHSLRPHTLSGHMALYKNVLHNSNNTLPRWYLESIGVYVSYLNKCDYCVKHHLSGFRRLVGDEDAADLFIESIERDSLDMFYDEKFYAGIQYARKLTLSVYLLSERDVEKLKGAGFSDGEVLEINQVASYFNYVNRTVQGLGVDLAGDVLGLSPNASEDPDNWSHS